MDLMYRTLITCFLTSVHKNKRSKTYANPGLPSSLTKARAVIRPSTKMTTLAFDWLIHFRILFNRYNYGQRRNFTRQVEASSQFPVLSMFAGGFVS